MTFWRGQEIALRGAPATPPPYYVFYEPRMLLPLLTTLAEEEKALFLDGIESISWFNKRWLEHRLEAQAEKKQAFAGLLLSKERMDTIDTIQQQWIVLNDQSM